MSAVQRLNIFSFAWAKFKKNLASSFFCQRQNTATSFLSGLYWFFPDVLRGGDLPDMNIYKGKCTQYAFLLNPLKHPAYLAEIVQSPLSLAVIIFNSPL